MNCFDTSALIDYLEGSEELKQVLETRENQPFFAPTVVLHEVFVGAARLRGEEGVREVREDLHWIEPLELTVDDAAEAAYMSAELSDAGTPIGSMDTLIAGICRSSGSTLITRDGHFDRVDDLETLTY
ncbi:type II toxin-antitoxin system VapC family toxin [Haloprofundus sp. MHR1]|uniref:type II toxin-antitoxin system VapC family toxin n=1 Tax=Haloprofundus sp. MHR1 TaxID=2572921 RepID=UPI0010BE2F66|nr:type II toxin-antitoxin system VapC family toxin [Haloprofundus sp. MHR1]QCJ45951.1 type II toxin-antitoxin system VapC family toxin [Haloprofundus sp. MHR1]